MQLLTFSHNQPCSKTWPCKPNTQATVVDNIAMGMDMGAHIVYIDDIDLDVEFVRVGIDIDDTDIDDLDTDR